MAFKMKGSPYGEKRSGEMDMKPRMSANFGKSGINNADGSPVKGLLGKIMDPLGLFKKGKKMLGGKPCPPGAAAGVPGSAAAPAAAAGAAGAGAAGAAAPAAPPAAPVPEETPAVA